MTPNDEKSEILAAAGIGMPLRRTLAGLAIDPVRMRAIVRPAAQRRRRKTQSRTVEGGTDPMNVTLPEQTTHVQPAEADARPLLNEKQAAQLLGVCQRTMYTLRASGALPHIRIRRRVFYRGEDIDLFLASQARTGIPTEFRLTEQQLAGRSRKGARGKAARERRKQS